MRLFILTIILFCAAGVSAQTVCISQEAANQAAQNARELAATKDKIAVLESALIEKDKNTAEVKATAAKNEADLKESLHKTENALATATGQLIGAEATITREQAIIDLLLKSVRKKCMPLSLCF